MKDLPVYNMIKKYIDKNPTIFHMPGHKMGNKVLDYYTKDMIKWDLTEIPDTDNLHEPQSAIKEAQEKLAKAFGAEESFFLVNGSTCGIHAILLSVCKANDKVIVGRDCHKSVLNILSFLEANVVFVNPEYNEEFGIYCGYNPEKIEKTVDENPDCVMVILTSPNYYGVCSDIESIAQKVHNKDKILVVDEAHGAHLKFSKKLPKSAIEQGADAVIQSAHKTLPALTQTAYLHVKSNRINRRKLKNILRMIQTSSPSFIFMTSLDIARYIMENEGEKMINDLCGLVDNFIYKMNNVEGIKILNCDLHDKTRLVINFSDVGIVGYDVEKLLLSKYGIQVEMSDINNIVCITTVCDDKESFDKLEKAIKDIVLNSSKVKKENVVIKGLKLDEQEEIKLININQYDTMLVNLEDSVDKVSANMIVPYPPGIPYIIMGQKIENKHIKILKKFLELGANVNGIDEGKIEVLNKK